MYALYAYIHYIIMLLAYFIFWSRGDKISVHNNQRGIKFHYIIIEEEQISVHRNQGGYKISVHRNQGGSISVHIVKGDKISVHGDYRKSPAPTHK